MALKRASVDHVNGSAVYMPVTANFQKLFKM